MYIYIYKTHTHTSCSARLEPGSQCIRLGGCAPSRDISAVCRSSSSWHREIMNSNGRHSSSTLPWCNMPKHEAKFR